MIRALQILGILVGVAILAANLREAWIEVQGQEVPVAWTMASLSTALLVLMYAGLAWLWSAMARELGARIHFGTAIQFWSISNLGRYVPGKIWQITGVVLAASDFGVPPGLAATVGILSFGFMVCAGALVGFAFVPRLFASEGPRVAFAAASLLALLAPIVRPSLLHDAMRRLPRRLSAGEVSIPTRAGMLRIAGWFLLVWLVHGVVFQVFCGAFVDVSLRDLPEVTGAFCLAYIAGLLAPIAPGGIGVREEVLGETLGHVLPGAPVHVIAIGARLWTMIGEIVVLVLAVVLRMRARQARSANEDPS